MRHPSLLRKNPDWSPELTVDTARKPILWALLMLCVMTAGLVIYRWTDGTPDPIVSAVLLIATAWTAALGVTKGPLNRFFLVGSPYFAAGLSLATMAVLQLVGDPLDERHTNALLGAYLTLPIAYLLFFLLRRPSEALIAAIVTCTAAVTLQATLPPLFAGRYTSGGWAASMTSIFQGALILLFFSVLRLRSDRELLNAVLQSSRNAVVVLSLPRTSGPEQEPGTGVSGASGAGERMLKVSLANEAASRTFGVGAGALLTASGDWSDADELLVLLTEALRCAKELDVEAELHTTGAPRWFRVTASPFQCGLAVTFADISHHKRGEQRALDMARTDQLTGVANRRGFEVEAALRAQIAEVTGEGLTVCYVDLDGFKAVNDTYGHDAGDELLKHFAGRLRSAVRSSDFVARIGGDEFVVLADGLPDADVEAYFARVNDSLRSPYHVHGVRLSLAASLGVAVGRHDIEDAMGAADAAMYRAKQRGGGIEIDRLLARRELVPA